MGCLINLPYNFSELDKAKIVNRINIRQNKEICTLSSFIKINVKETKIQNKKVYPEDNSI